MPSTTPIINPPVGVTQSTQAQVTAVLPTDLVPILRLVPGGGYVNVNVVGTGIVIPGGAAGGAPQWVQDTPYPEATLIYDAGIVYRASRALAASPTHPAGEPLWEAIGPGVASAPAPSTYYSARYSAPADGVQTITPADVPGLASATDILQVGVRAADGTLDPEFFEGDGYTFDVRTRTLKVIGGSPNPGDYVKQGDVLSIKYLTGALGNGQGTGGPGTFAALTDQPTDNPALAATLQQQDSRDVGQELRLSALELQPLPALIARNLAQAVTYRGVQMSDALNVLAVANSIYGTIFCFLTTAMTSDATLTAGTRILGNGFDLTMTGRTLTHREGNRILNLTMEGGTTNCARGGPFGPSTVFIGGWSLNMQHRAAPGTEVRMINREITNSDPAAIVFAGGGKFILSGTTPTPTAAQIEPGTTVVRADPAAPGTGIDYANPVTLTAATTLTANKAYYVTGTGYTLTLPPGAVGDLVFVQIASAATNAAFPLAGTSLTLYAGDTATVRRTADGWKHTGGDITPTFARLEYNFDGSGWVLGTNYIPCRSIVSGASIPGLTDTATGQATIQVAGLYSVKGFVITRSATPGYIEAFVQCVPASGAPAYYLASANISGFDVDTYVGSENFGADVRLAVGDVVRLGFYTANGNTVAYPAQTRCWFSLLQLA